MQKIWKLKQENIIRLSGDPGMDERDERRKNEEEKLEASQWVLPVIGP